MTPVTWADLAQVRRWVAWRTEVRTGSTKPTKVPKSPCGIRDAASTRPDDWGTRPQAEDAFRSLPPSPEGLGGVGLILGDWDGIAIGGVDLDSCRDPVTGALTDWAMQVLDLLGTYAEVSPSGTGAKAFFVMEPGAVDRLRSMKLLEPAGFGRSFKRGNGGDHPPAVEVHLGGRYYAVTDDHLDSTPAEPCVVSTTTLEILFRDIGPAFAKGDREKRHPDRSRAAFALARRTHTAGGSFDDFSAALETDPDLAAWKMEKGLANGGRELLRAWNRSTEPEPWPAPDVTLAVADIQPAPHLPIDVFPPPWTEWIELSAIRAGSPLDYPALALLVVIGATIGNARWAGPWDGWKHPPVIWGACVGNPSSGKSPGMDAATGPLEDLAGIMNDDWEERCQRYRTEAQTAKEKRKKWESEVKVAIDLSTPPPLEPVDAKDPDKPTKRRVYTNDPTIEAARDLSAANPRGLLLYRDELAGWLAAMGKYGNGSAAGDRAFWLQSFDGKRWSSDRVKDDGNAPDIPHLTFGVLGAFQPDRLASALLAGDDDGLAARFLYAWPDPPPDLSPPPTDTALPIDLAAALGRLRDLPMLDGCPVVLPFIDAAAATLQEWRQEVRDMELGAHGLVLSWLGKLPGMAIRLAAIFAHLTWLSGPDGAPPPERIEKDDLVRALGFLSDYAIPMAHRAFGEAALPEAERDSRRLARWYLRQPVPRLPILNSRQLKRMKNGPGIANAARIDAALVELHELGWVRPAPNRDGGTPGRQRNDWQVNPALLDYRT
ncbi:MAG: DUF3987 domain-containing protein [Acetobacteraceae bacterium]